MENDLSSIAKIDMFDSYRKSIKPSLLFGSPKAPNFEYVNEIYHIAIELGWPTQITTVTFQDVDYPVIKITFGYCDLYVDPFAAYSDYYDRAYEMFSDLVVHCMQYRNWLTSIVGSYKIDTLEN